MRLPQFLEAILGVERMHLERGGVNQKARPDEFVVLPVIAQDVADVLAEEALDALAELLDAIDVGLRHAPGAVRRVGRARLERPDFFLHAEIPRNVGDEVFRVLTRMRYQPAVRFAPPYYNDALYIDALASSSRAAVSGLGFEPDVILASFHGIPQAYVDKGDPYYVHCIETMRLLRGKLAFDETKLLLTFQSRFGRAQWLEPATDQTVKQLAQKGVKNIAVITPGFSADCLETLEEIAVENAHIFERHGGANFAAIPCLNDSPPGMQVIAQIVERELKGWL